MVGRGILIAWLLGSIPAGLGCASGRPPALTPQVQLGPGAQTRPARVLVLSAACGSMEYRCPREYVETVDNIVRSSLDFAGYALVDARQLRLQTRQRRETQDSTRSAQDVTTTQEGGPLGIPVDRSTTTTRSQSESESSRVELDGPGFEDLTVPERLAVLSLAGADSVLTVRIVIGGQRGVWRPDQTVEVMVKLGVKSGDVLAWASRCLASSNDFATVDAALEAAARCAMRGAGGG